VEDGDRFRLDGVHHLVEVGLDDCYLVEVGLDDRLELCEQPVRLAQMVLVAKQMLAQSAPQVQQEPHQQEQVLEPLQEPPQVQVQLLRVQLALQTGLAAQMK